MIKKRQSEEETRQEAHCKKTSNHVLLYHPPSLRRDKTVSCLPGAPSSMLQGKDTNQDEHDKKRTARKTNNHVPRALTTSQQILSHARCPCVYVQPTLLRGTAVPNLYYGGAALDSAGPALLRALSVPRDCTCTIPGTCTIQPALYRAQYCTRIDSIKITPIW